ncbi:hypothetical protein TrLO_g12345 [Triparma laevis f. longispina]|uniref:Fe2OG dioxygenase domain-containing protein n=1 Tax=Triparma laevis f. longispina TaxID=1714387 RepID=A0A9W7FU86_9STRA|nr:hypothetical protein TrLO_g12345 [Triparma laevis f. longispina]
MSWTIESEGNDIEGGCVTVKIGLPSLSSLSELDLFVQTEAGSITSHLQLEFDPCVGVETINIDLGCVVNGDNDIVKAKWSKKRKELTVKLACIGEGGLGGDVADQSEITSEQLKSSITPPLPPPQPTLPSSITKSSKTFFPTCSLLFGSTRYFEDLIESTQDYRQQSTDSNLIKIGGLIYKGCEGVERLDKVKELSDSFAQTLPLSSRSVLEEYINSEIGHLVHLVQKKVEKEVNPSIVDDAAQRILEYVCSTGKMPHEGLEVERELYTLKRDYLDSTVFSTLQNDVLKHPGILDSSSASLGVGFDTTKGFIFRFNNSGIPKFKEHEWGTSLIPFFEEAREKDVDAYVLNVLYCPEGGGGGYSVNFHKDATLALRQGAMVSGVKQRLAWSVSVLYLNVPQGMEGGELVLRDVSRSSLKGEERYMEGVEVDAVVEPEENLGVVFRGDAEHAVKGWKGGEGGRVSLVLEQYKVPVGDRGWLLEFELVEPGKYKKERYED